MVQKEIRSVFVLADNIVMAGFLKELLDSLENISVRFFCSRSSPLNSHEFPWVTPVCLKEQGDLFLNFDIGISCHSKQIFPKGIINSVVCYNIHPGYNPYNRGWYPQVFSILNGFPAGCTIHRMTMEIDGGPIVDQVEVPVKPYDTSESVYSKVLESEKELLASNIYEMIFSEKPLGTDTPEVGNYNSVKDFNALRFINANEQVKVSEFIDLLRALSHPPYWNAYFLDPKGNRVYLRLELKKEDV